MPTKLLHTLLYALFVLPVLFLLDLVWIGGIASSFYRENLGDLLAPTIVWAPAILFYIVYAIALAVFAVAPSVRTHSLSEAGLRGALLGLAAYAGYDLTNWATITNWPAIVSIVDLMWGIIVSAVAASWAYLIATHVAKINP